MSRSRKKNIAGGITTSTSEKIDKRLWHRAFRRENKTLAKIQRLQDDEMLFPAVRERSDTWAFSKDGKRIYCTETELRKQIHAEIKTVLDRGFYNYYLRGGRKISTAWLLEKMCNYLHIPKTPKAASRVLQKDVDRFLRYYIRRYKSK